MKHNLFIEWKHIGNDITGTCDRCSLTGSAIREVLDQLEPYFRETNVVAWFRETVLPDSRIDESNQVVINGIPLEEYMSDARVVQTPCCSCACITGQDEAECRAIDVGDERFEAIPADLLKSVIIEIVESWKEPCGCGCDCRPTTKCE